VRPLQTLPPPVEEISKELAGKINVYEVDIDAKQLLSQSIGIQSLPTPMLIPDEG